MPRTAEYEELRSKHPVAPPPKRAMPALPSNPDEPAVEIPETGGGPHPAPKPAPAAPAVPGHGSAPVEEVTGGPGGAKAEEAASAGGFKPVGTESEDYLQAQIKRHKAEQTFAEATKPKPGTTVPAGPPAPTSGQKGDTGQAVAADMLVQNDRSIKQAQQNAAKLAAKQASSWTAIEKQAGNNQTTFQTVVQGMGLTPAQAASAWTTVSALGPTYTGDQVTNAIEGSDWFNQAFPGIKLAEANGNPVPDPATYVSYAATARQQAALAGIPPGYFTDAEIGDLIGNGVDQQTLQTRIQDAGKAVQGAITPQAAQYLQSQYGVSQGDLMAVWLNPQANVPLLNSKVQAATIGGAAQLAGYGTIDKGLALSAAENSSSGITNFAQQLEQGAPMLGLEQGGLETNDMEKVAPGTEAAIALNEGTAAQQRAQVMAVGARVGASSGGGGFGATGRGTGAGSGAEQGAKGDVMQ